MLIMIKHLSVRYFIIFPPRTILQREMTNAEICRKLVIMVSFHRISKKNLAKGHTYGLGMQ